MVRVIGHPEHMEDMLRTCVLKFRKRLGLYLPLSEFFVITIATLPVLSAPFEASLYGSRVDHLSALELKLEISYVDIRPENPSSLSGDKIIAKVGIVAYRIELPEQLSRVHSMFHVSNMKKCLLDKTLGIPLDEIQIDDKLHFIEEPVEIIDREVKRLKQSRIPIVKVRWNSRRGPEFTWECEDQMQKKYPNLFANSAPIVDVTS
ncbi:hypothetical protein Tco_1245933 [Tanacetum coccineum]